LERGMQSAPSLPARGLGERSKLPLPSGVRDGAIRPLEGFVAFYYTG